MVANQFLETLKMYHYVMHKKEKKQTRSRPKKFINIMEDWSSLDEIIMPVEINLDQGNRFIVIDKRTNDC